MEDDRLTQALDRAEQAASRIDRALERGVAPRHAGKDEQIRDEVRAVVAELDSMIRTAQG